MFQKWNGRRPDINRISYLSFTVYMDFYKYFNIIKLVILLKGRVRVKIILILLHGFTLYVLRFVILHLVALCLI